MMQSRMSVCQRFCAIRRTGAVLPTRFHVEMETAANIDSRTNRDEARYAALKEFRCVESINPRSRPCDMSSSYEFVDETRMRNAGANQAREHEAE